MALDKRWEGQWKLSVTAEGTQNETRYVGYDTTYYVLHPVSDKFNKEIADASLQAARSAQASADYAKWGGIVSALALVGTLATIGIEYAKERNRKLAEWRKLYQLHSQQIMQVFSKCINEISLAHIEYKDGQLQVDNPYSEPDDYLLPQAKDHIKKSYKDIWKPYEGLKKESEQNKKDIIGIIAATDKPSFESIIVKKVEQRCPTLKRVKDEGQAVDSYVDRIVFKLIFDELKEVDKPGYPVLPTARP